jgi:hypothetical protein
LCSRWVLKMLTEEHKLKWQASVFLTWYIEQGGDFLNLIGTGDKIWVLHVTPELKQQSMEWRRTSLQIKKNSNRPFQLASWCAQWFGTENAFYLWNSCLRAQQSMQVSVVSCDPEQATWHA